MRFERDEFIMIRKITRQDKDDFIRLSVQFYRSEAVMHDIPEAYHVAAFEEIMRSNAYAAAYMIEREEKPVGYLLVAKTYSREAGGPVWWLEELFVLPSFRGKGLGREAFAFIEGEAAREKVKRLRLEAERENDRAISLYKRLGYAPLGYMQMFKEQSP